MKDTKRSFLTSCVALFLCFAMLLGTTFAWFTDVVTSSGNKIVSGTLDLDLQLKDKDSGTYSSINESSDPIFNYDKWEPGYTDAKVLKVENVGSLAFKWVGNFVSREAISNLSEVIDVYIKTSDSDISYPAGREELTLANGWKNVGTLNQIIDAPDHPVSGALLSGESDYFAIALHMQESAGNEYQGKELGAFDIAVHAAQYSAEEDSFDKDYDKDAAWPEGVIHGGITASANVSKDANGKLSSAVSVQSGDNKIGADLPAGVQLEDGKDKITVTVSNKTEADANVSLSDTEKMLPIDVHIDGVATNNDVPIAVFLSEWLPIGLNMGNYQLYHVENGATNQMTLIDDSATPAHNDFKYNPATGDVTLYMATFSEVALVADTENKWEGEFDYSWYDAEKDDLKIANADQLAAFGAIVGGMDGQTQDSFKGKTVKLLSNINLGDKESENNPNIIFYPIGYYNSEGTYERTNTAITSGLRNFEGTFDGNGNTISNFYQNTWEMKGDHNWYSPEEQYYRDGMGLFGRICGGTVKNLTVSNFSSDGEIATTGVIAAYADGATFENIAITNCNPRVYNIGNGGIVGCVGWYAKEADLKTTFTNITVDNSNKISALWGSYDVACGGIVGQYYPTSGQSSANYPVNAGIHFENCHVAAQMDVYNDVCANYQYYAYRYTGMMIGSVRENVTIDGHVYPKMDGITAENCTVHFGDWNDYYYCELVANSLASYTHDHQMSRLTQVASVDVNNKTVTDLDGKTTAIPTSGRVNYVVVKAKDVNGMWIHGDGHDYAECYHFVNGVQHFHDVADSDNPNPTETVNGVAGVLKEDKQLIYREFNQLFTGYGWGVTSKGIGDLAGITILDREEGNSVVKFEKSDNVQTEYETETTYEIGDFFKAAVISDPNLSIISENVVVTVSPVYGTSSTVTGTYVANEDDWTKGTLVFSGMGEAIVTINDYYFCKTTSVTVNVVGADKFDTNFVNYKNYLYRVGNANDSTVALGTIFKHSGKGTIDSSSVNVTFATIGGNAAGSFSANTSDWTKGTIQFTGTGVLNLTITAKNAKPFELNLEVVDAVNATGATNATSNNVVLLKDCGSNGFTVSDGYSFYGNGFKVTCSGKGSYLNNGGMSLGYVSVQTGGILDNVQVVCDIYPNAFVYTEEVKVSSNIDTSYNVAGKTYYMYQLSAISVSGDGSVVANCYAYGGRNNILVGGGDVTIENTVTECGTLSNIQLKGSSDDTVIIKDVTTIQYKNVSKYDSTKTMLGFGIVVGDNESTSNPVIILKGDLKQYNWVTSEDESVSNAYAKTAISSALTVENYQHTIDDKNTVNMGIAYLNSCTTAFPTENDQRINKQSIPYVMSKITMQGNTGYVYSITKNTIDGTSRYNAEADGITPYVSNAQRDVAPKPVFSLGNQAVDGEDCYLKGDINGITARYENGQSAFTLDITKLFSASKYGHSCTVNSLCIDPDGNELRDVVTLNKSGVYTLRFTVLDTEFYSVAGEKVERSKEYYYSVPITLTISEPSVPDATLTVNTSTTYTGSYVDSTADGSKKLSINPLTPITVTDAGALFSLKSNVKSVDIAYSATGTDGNGNAFGGTTTITVTYNEGQVLKIVLAKPTSNSPGNPKTITYDSSSGTVKSTKALAKNSCTAATWAVSSYSFTGINGKTVSANGVSFTIAADTSGGGCVTPDTLVTLADGTQKRIDQITYDDQLLVWDFYNGKYAVAPAAIIFNHVYADNTIIKLSFSDGTVVKVTNLHQFYDNDLNRFVSIDAETVSQFVGHSFAKQCGDGYTTVTLEDYEVSVEYEAAYGIISAYHYNIIVEGMISTDFMNEDYALFNYFKLGDDMTFDKAQMQEDIQKYGLYTYEDFADYLTYEQFVGFNVQYFKIAVGKGEYTYEGILELIDNYLNK